MEERHLLAGRAVTFSDTNCGGGRGCCVYDRGWECEVCDIFGMTAMARATVGPASWRSSRGGGGNG